MQIKYVTMPTMWPGDYISVVHHNNWMDTCVFVYRDYACHRLILLSFSTWDVVTISPTPSSVFIGPGFRSELHSRWRRWRIVHCMAPHHRTWRRHSHVSPTCRTDAGSGPPPRNNLTFRPVVGPLSEVVPFLLLQQRCGMACQAMLRRPRRCRCSRTGWRHTCSAAATKLIDFEWHFLFLVIISPPEQWSLQ